MNLLRLCASLLVLGALSSCVPSESPGAGAGNTSAPSSSGSADPSTWRAVEAGPLSPRHGVAAAWTGTEVVLVGGDTQAPCPPNTDCAYSPQPRADAAAYNPATDRWRLLPDAPAAITGGRAWWTGSDLIVVGDGHTFGLDPAGGTWRRLGPSPDVGPSAALTADGLVFVAYSQRSGKHPVDWLLDESGRWSALARDPFAESYDRSMAWDGERLWLLSMAVENHFGAHEGASSRLAVLDDGRWRVAEARTPPFTYEQRTWWYDDRLVVGRGTYGGTGRAFDPRTSTWSELPTTGDDSCAAPAAGPGPTWLSVGARLVGAGAAESVSLPPCPALTRGDLEPDLAVWAGDQLFVWGADFDRSTTTGLMWTPPPPDPTQPG